MWVSMFTMSLWPKYFNCPCSLTSDLDKYFLIIILFYISFSYSYLLIIRKYSLINLFAATCLAALQSLPSDCLWANLIVHNKCHVAWMRWSHKVRKWRLQAKIPQQANTNSKFPRHAFVRFGANQRQVKDDSLAIVKLRTCNYSIVNHAWSCHSPASEHLMATISHLNLHSRRSSGTAQGLTVCESPMGKHYKCGFGLLWCWFAHQIHLVTYTATTPPIASDVKVAGISGD